MKFYKIILGTFVIVATALTAQSAYAALVPSLNLVPNSDGTVQVVVVGADPNVSTLLYYPSSTGFSTANLGITNSNGNLTSTINSNTYGITSGSMVYVFANGAQSIQVAWPNYSATNSSSFTLNLTNSTITVGQSITLTALNGNSVAVSNNTNPSIAGANISGSQITVTGYTPGATNITFCSVGNGCATAYITVQPATNTGTATASNLTLSQSNVSLSVGQTLPIAISGPGSYILSTNSSPSIVMAGVNGNTLNLTGQSFGSSNVSICTSSYLQCASVYVYVSPTAPGTNPISSPQSIPPVLSSFTLSSNNLNNAFNGQGDLLTIQFSTNQAVINPVVTVAGTKIVLSGNNSGPYTGSYPVTGNEAQPLQIGVTFTNASGMTGQANMAISTNTANTGSVTVIPNTSSTNLGTVVPTAPSVSSSVTFTQYLKVGSTGSEVTALQQRLTSDGLYTGPITGTFGGLTEAAVEKYQAKHGLDTLGVVGPGTRKLLNQGI